MSSSLFKTSPLPQQTMPAQNQTTDNTKEINQMVETARTLAGNNPDPTSNANMFLSAARAKGMSDDEIKAFIAQVSKLFKSVH